MYSNCDLPLITCITDVSIHSSWINPNTNIYFVASQKSKDELIQRNTRKGYLYYWDPCKRRFYKN